MKKCVCILSVLLAVAGFAFAEKKAVYTVQSVVGKVTYEVSNGEWAEVKAGMKLDVDANINTGLNSTVELVADGTTVSVKPMKKGTVSDLVAVSNAKSGLKIGSKVTREEIAQAAGKKVSGSVATARASEAKADIEWDE